MVMAKLAAALLLLVSVAGAAQAQVAQKHPVAPGTTGQYDSYPEWAQRAFEPKN
jgi:hypothetical protein